MATTKRPTADQIRDEIYAAIDKAGAGGLSRSGLYGVNPEHRQHAPTLKAAQIDAAVNALIAEGRVVVASEPSGGGRTGTVYRSVAALARESWFQAEVKRRKLDRPRGIRVEGRVK